MAMFNINPNELSYEQALELQKHAQEIVAAKQQEARAAAIGQIVHLAKLHGFSAEDVRKALATRKAGATSTAGSPLAGTKVEPKYRNPQNPEQTWTGRGMAPAWMRALPRENWDAYLIPTEQVTPPAANPAPVAVTPEVEPV
jgi:DNA-binding protein H-NS